MADPADLFRAMADRIERNFPAEFAGAILIVPPETADGSGGETVELLLIDPRNDPGHFWWTASEKIKQMIDLMQKRQQPYGFNR